MSSNGSNITDENIRSKRRMKKKQRKDREDLNPENSFKNKNEEDKYDLEENKDRQNKYMHKRHSAFTIQQDINNEYNSDENSSNHSPRRK